MRLHLYNEIFDSFFVVVDFSYQTPKIKINLSQK